MVLGVHWTLRQGGMGCYANNIVIVRQHAREYHHLDDISPYEKKTKMKTTKEKVLMNTV